MASVNSDSPFARLSLLGVLALSLFVALGARLWYLQVLTETEAQEQAEANIVRRISVPAPRGRIVDISGKVLVDNRPSNVVVIDGFVLRNEMSAAERSDLALRMAREITGTGRLVKVAAIEEAMNDTQYGPFDQVPIAFDVTEEFQVFLAERSHEFPGVEVVERTVRDYPYDTLAAHVLGYVGPLTQRELDSRDEHPKDYQAVDEIGKAGAELAFEDWLRGTPGWREFEVDAKGNVIRQLDYVPPVAGNDVQLTIDVDIQALVETELAQGLIDAQGEQDKDVIERYATFAAPAGAAVVLDPRDGAVRAMASYPTYDPSAFIGGISTEEFDQLTAAGSYAPLNNRAIQGLYSPGSTFKPFTAYAAIDTGLLGPRGFLRIDQYTPDPGYYELVSCEGDQCRFQNANEAEYGDVDLRRSLTVSSDVYFYKLAEQFSVRRGFDTDEVQQTAREFGFGAASGIALPYEATGLIPDPEIKQQRHEENPEAFPDADWRTGDTLNVSIGQGDVNATPLQIANAYAVFANGGTLFAPNIAARVIDPITGEIIMEFGPRVVNEVWLPPEARDPIVDGLIGVTQQEEGTAFDAFEDFPTLSWQVAAKTGTSEVDGKSDFAVFAAFGPEPESEYVVAIVLEEAGFGGEAAAPVVRRVLEPIATNTVAERLTDEELEELAANPTPEPEAGAELAEGG
jgi:penicillin-binding protein 2